MFVPRPDKESKLSLSLAEEDVEAITRLLSLLLEQTGRLAPAPASVSNDIVSNDHGAQAIAMATMVVAQRKRRAEYFAKALFSEPGWDMLLELYIGDMRGKRHTVGELIELVGIPSTTSIRWINYLEKERLIEREPHTRDRRVVCIRITEKARLRLDEYFTDFPVDIGRMPASDNLDHSADSIRSNQR